MRPFQLKKEKLTTEGGCILWGSQVIIPKSLRKNVLEQLHGVHVGVSRMKMLARKFFMVAKFGQGNRGYG